MSQIIQYLTNNNIQDENTTTSIKTNPIELSIIHKSRFLLDSQNVYIILLIFKKDKENLVENSPFPTGLWGIIESSSNMTPRGLLYAFPNNNSQNLESFLLSKRELEDSEFKYMLFIWNGKKASAYLRSIALMKAFDLDKALSNSNLVQFLYNGFYIRKNNNNIVERSEPINMGDIINNTIENSEDSTPSSEKISNFHETVYLFKWLYPISDKKKKKKKKDDKKPKKEQILFKGFNSNFLETSEKRDFYSNFTFVDLKSNQDNIDNNIDDEENDNEIMSNIPSINFGKSSLINTNNKTKVMPLKLNLNLNLPNKTSLNDNNSNSKSSGKDDKSSKRKDDNGDDGISLDDDTNLDLDIHNNNENKIKIKDKDSQIKIPKLMVSLQRNILNDEIITERSKKKAEEEDNLNEIPESILKKASDNIINLENKEGINIQALNENYNLKDGERKKIINEYYSKHLSEIIPNFLYLSSYNAAKNKELIDKNNITNIINCAADFCNNEFANDPKLNYLSFYLKDHVMENIECVFYECIEYIESVKEKGGRVLVHCIQGISRSVSIVMAYLIFKKKYTYDKAFTLVQSKREISSPNFGFSIQLQNFYLRLYEPPEKYRYIPKIFAVGSFQNEQPNKIVCRLMNEPFYEMKDNSQTRMLDKRGVFIIVSINSIYLWIGSKLNIKIKDIYLDSANNYIKLLQKYENAPKNNIILY